MNFNRIFSVSLFLFLLLLNSRQASSLTQDNDYIGYIIGAEAAEPNGSIEFDNMTQVQNR